MALESAKLPNDMAQRILTKRLDQDFRKEPGAWRLLNAESVSGALTRDRRVIYST